MRAAPALLTAVLLTDPLSAKIESARLTDPSGGVTGAVRIASGESIPLVPSLGLGALPLDGTLRDAVADPAALAAPKPARGLWISTPPAAKPPKKAKRAVDQLKSVAGSGRGL